MIPLSMVKRARMPERKRGRGRPSYGVSEAIVPPIKAPQALVDAMRERAERDGITTSEAWRRAAREWLGLKPDAYEKYLDEKENE